MDGACTHAVDEMHSCVLGAPNNGLMCALCAYRIRDSGAHVTCEVGVVHHRDEVDARRINVARLMAYVWAQCRGKLRTRPPKKRVMRVENHGMGTGHVCDMGACQSLGGDFVSNSGGIAG